MTNDLTSAIEAERRRGDFAIFDFDHTCIKADIGEALMNHFVAVGRLHGALLEEYESLLDQGRIREAYILYGEMLEGFSEQEVVTAVQATIKELGGLEVHTSVIELMEYLRQRGVSIWIMSASHELAVRIAAQQVGINAQIIGIRNVILDGRFAAQLQKPTSMLEGKVECMRTYIHPTQNPLIVVDDSSTGLPLLQTAKIKVVVNRDPEFVAHARQNGWFIL